MPSLFRGAGPLFIAQSIRMAFTLSTSTFSGRSSSIDKSLYLYLGVFFVFLHTDLFPFRFCTMSVLAITDRGELTLMSLASTFIPVIRF